MNKQLDKEVIEKVLKIPFIEDNLGCWVRLREYEDAALFRPSENMSDAWVIAEKLNKYGDFNLYSDCDKWKAELLIISDGAHEFSSESAPLAICKVAVDYFSQ